MNQASIMRFLISIIFSFAVVHLSTCFMNFKEFQASKLNRCYDEVVDRVNQVSVNGQSLPLPSSMETFVSLVERLETSNPTWRAQEIAKKLLLSFRIDNLPSGHKVMWEMSNFNELEKTFFNIPRTSSYSNHFSEEDWSSDEECALHFMLSHSVNQSVKANEETLEDGIAKFPNEFGVVSLSSRWNHAFALGKVLLGAFAGLSGGNQLEATEIYGKLKPGEQDPKLAGVKVNRIYAVTFGSIVSATVNEGFKTGNVDFQPNGLWNDAACPTEYKLESNNKKHITNSLVRGAIDGLLIGNSLEKNSESQSLRLSQILRMYYGPEGLSEDGRRSVSGSGDVRWCNRKRLLDQVASQLRDEMVNFNKLYASYLGSNADDTANDPINEVINHIQNSGPILEDIEQTDCSTSDSNSPEKKIATPFDIFPIIDINSQTLQKSFQIEVLGNMSVNFNIRPNGNTVGAYSNMRPLLGRGLDTIVNNSGIAGCPSCFVRYYGRKTNKLDDVELMERLNQTLTDFVENYDENKNDESDNAAPAKVVLLFNYQNQVNDAQRLRDAVWEIERSFREVTILGIGSRKENLRVFTQNDDTDIYTESSNAAEFTKKLWARLAKVPAEFQNKECYQGERSSGKIDAFVPYGKLQYWAMYPKYFLKSFNIVMRFAAVDGAQIRVCYSRSYRSIFEEKNPNDCKESTGDEIRFDVRNPCHRRNEHNCDPFYFSVEGKKLSNNPCQNPKCRTTSDIQFEFQHEGISCNTASLMTLSSLCLTLVALALFMRRL